MTATASETSRLWRRGRDTSGLVVAIAADADASGRILPILPGSNMDYAGDGAQQLAGLRSVRMLGSASSTGKVHAPLHPPSARTHARTHARARVRVRACV
eukprot:gene16480-biopygen21797